MSHVDEGGGVLHAYLDGELAPAERAALEAHIAECPTCRARLAEERALIERASQLLGKARPVERPAPPLHELRKPRIVWRMRVPLAWAASVVLALVVGYNLRVSSGVPESTLGDSGDSLHYFLNDQARGEVSGYSMRAAPESIREEAPARAERELAQRRDAPPPTDVVAGEIVLQDAREADKPAAAPAPTPGMAAIRSAPVRQQTPEPVPSVRVDSLALARDYEGAGAVAGVRGRLVATEWPIIRRGSAREMLGAEPVGIPGLPVRDIRSSPAGDGTVLVQQVIDSTTVIQLFQRPALAERGLADSFVDRLEARRARPTAPANKSAADRLARFVGGLRVEIAGPVSQDSLNRLLESVKPLP